MRRSVLLVAAWAALVGGAVAVVAAIFVGGFFLLYVGIAAAALSMTLAVGYLLRGSAGARPPDDHDSRPSTRPGAPSERS